MSATASKANRQHLRRVEIDAGDVVSHLDVAVVVSVVAMVRGDVEAHEARELTRDVTIAVAFVGNMVTLRVINLDEPAKPARQA